ncbi:unnamed protein product [Closterium sp. Naga37s-1]|nr:unnamed protein product [Closterium sp. Naga37s-1]
MSLEGSSKSRTACVWKCPSPPDSSVAPPAPGDRGVPSTFLISQAPPFRRRLRPRPFFPLLPRVLLLGPHGSALLPRSGSRCSAPLVRPVALFPPGSTLPRRFPLFLVPQMEVDALAIVATALAHSSPGGVPGRQAPALLRAASALAGHGASSRPSRGRRVQGRRSRDPVFRSPPGRAPACLRPRQRQMFRRSQLPPMPPPRSGRRPGSLPRSQQSSPQPTPLPVPTLVTQTTSPPRTVPDPPPDPAPASAVVAPGGWQSVKLSRRQKRRQFCQPAPMLSQPPLAPPRQQ